MKKKQLPIILASIFLVISISVFFYVKTLKRYHESDVSSGALSQEENKDLISLQKEVKSDQELDITYGSKDAPVTIIEYASYGCSHCSSFFNNVYPNLLKTFVDNSKVRVILRDFPLDEPSLRAAQLVHCMPSSQKKDVIKVLFETQKSWAYSKQFPEKLENLAKISGMSGEIFHKCMENSELEKKILDSRMKAHRSYNVNSTPALIINGEKYIGKFTWEGLASHINNLLQ